MLPLYALIVILLSVGSCDSSSEARQDGNEEDLTTYGYIKAYANLSFTRPIEILTFPSSSDFLIVEQGGKMFRVPLDPSTEDKSEIGDVSTFITTGGNEQGLLGAAFSPNFLSNGHIFVNYTASSPNRTVIARFTYSHTTHKIDLASKLEILDFAQPFSNHNGGKIAFDTENMLLIASGDGGSGGDPRGYSQNKKSMLGKMLRLDVSASSENEPYKIPANNPFINDTTTLDEIYALGLRNVWKFSVDAAENRIWAADVGQATREEINLIQSGKNYGWNHREGFLPYGGSTEDKSQFEEPVYDYGRSDGGSVTGGYVYRGKFLTKLVGEYVYGDFVSGRIWALKLNGSEAENRLLIETGKMVATFGVDSLGEHYFGSFDGQIYKLVDAD